MSQASFCHLFSPHFQLVSCLLQFFDAAETPFSLHQINNFYIRLGQIIYFNYFCFGSFIFFDVCIAEIEKNTHFSPLETHLCHIRITIHTSTSAIIYHQSLNFILLLLSMNIQVLALMFSLDNGHR